MHDIVVIGAGPSGISMAVEARVAGVPAGQVLLLERAAEHSFTLRKYYPDTKLVTANYKGFEAACTGVMCIADASKTDTISYLDDAIARHDIRVRYGESVHRIHKHEGQQRFTIYTDRGEYQTRVVAISIGILGRPNKPDYPLPSALKARLLFDLTTTDVVDAGVLVVGGGDSASEYCQYLVQRGNRVTLSYRQHEFRRMNDINRRSLDALAGRGQVRLRLGSTIAGIDDAGGLPRVTFADGDAEGFDYVVYALGGTTPHSFLRMAGIEFNGEEPTLGESYETSVAGMFLVGDLSAGRKGGSIIWAFNSASTAVKKICRDYLDSSIPGQNLKV